MSPTVLRRTLWLALVLALPVPYLALESRWVPTAFLIEIAGFMVARVVAGAVAPATLVSAAFFVGQASAWTMGLYVAARACERAVERAVPARAQAPVMLCAIAAVVLGGMVATVSAPLAAGSGTTEQPARVRHGEPTRSRIEAFAGSGAARRRHVAAAERRG